MNTPSRNRNNCDGIEEIEEFVGFGSENGYKQRNIMSMLTPINKKKK